MGGNNCVAHTVLQLFTGEENVPQDQMRELAMSTRSLFNLASHATLPFAET